MEKTEFIGLWSNGKKSYSITKKGETIIVNEMNIGVTLSGYSLDYNFKRYEIPLVLFPELKLDEIAEFCNNWKSKDEEVAEKAKLTRRQEFEELVDRNIDVAKRLANLNDYEDM